MKKENLTKILHALTNMYSYEHAIELFENILISTKSDYVFLEATQPSGLTHPQRSEEHTSELQSQR